MTIFLKPFQFEWGRSDCTHFTDIGYRTNKVEAHPNPEGNGKSTLDFFKSQFNFNARECVTILGAHTLGRTHYKVSAYKYTWTLRAGHLFNNAYYKNFQALPEWYISQWDDNRCIKIGDAQGNIPDVKWVPSTFGFTKSGGNVNTVG